MILDRLGHGVRLRRLRPRLVLTLSLVAAVTAIAVAATSFVAVRELRLRRATDDAVLQGQFNLALAADELTGEGGEAARAAQVQRVLQALQRRGGFEIVAVADGRTFQSSVSLTARSVPEDLAELVAAGRVAAARRSVGGVPHVVVGGAVPSGTELWSFFPLDQLFDDLDDLRRVLGVAALATVALSAVVGSVAARPLLQPIARARDAARRVEGGDLATRLPETGAGADELAELSRSFNAMAAALERTVADLRTAEAGHRRFVADVSHELRTPITALATAADVLEHRVEALPEQDRRAARVMVAEAVRLRHLVEDLMEISRLDAGAAVLETDLIDLRRLIVGAVAERGWQDRVRTDDLERALVLGDRRRLDRVFTNLLDNALRHGSPPVEVALAGSGAEVVVEVRDHGPGIPVEHRAHVFERFSKADAARGRTSSSGLGLAIAREHVELHGGRIEVDDHPGGGARFRVVLPAAVAEPLPDGDGPVTVVPDDAVTPKQ